MVKKILSIRSDKSRHSAFSGIGAGNLSKGRLKTSLLFPQLLRFSPSMERRDKLRPKEIAIINPILILRQGRWGTFIKQTLRHGNLWGFLLYLRWTMSEGRYPYSLSQVIRLHLLMEAHLVFIPQGKATQGSYQKEHDTRFRLWRSLRHLPKRFNLDKYMDSNSHLNIPIAKGKVSSW